MLVPLYHNNYSLRVLLYAILKKLFVFYHMSLYNTNASLMFFFLSSLYYLLLDRCHWLLDRSGVYSVSGVYHYLTSPQMHQA